MNNVPGVCRWLGVQPADRSTDSATAARAKRVQLGLEDVAPVNCVTREASRSVRAYPLNVDVRLMDSPTGVHYNVKQAEMPVLAMSGAIGAPVSQGYGRIPTVFVSTTSHTVLATTEYQSPLKGGRLQLHPAAHSAPASPANRTLLYTRGSEPPAAAHQLPVDLLERLTLLRRMSPTTALVPRPGLQHEWAAVSRQCQHSRQPSAMSCSISSTQSRKLWVWDDNLAAASDGARPIAAVPAAAWRFCGESSAAQTEDAIDAGAAVGIGRQIGGSSEEDSELLVIVSSPRSTAAVLGSPSKPRYPFRPPGPCKHTAGNKAQQQRPGSAPCRSGSEEGAGELPTRRCGCPWRPATAAPARPARLGRPPPAHRPREEEQSADADVEAVLICVPRCLRPTSQARLGAPPRAAAGLQALAPQVEAACQTTIIVSSEGEAQEATDLVVVASPRRRCHAAGATEEQVVCIRHEQRAEAPAAGGGAAASPRTWALLPSTTASEAATTAAAAAQGRGKESPGSGAHNHTTLSIHVPGSGGTWAVSAEVETSGTGQFSAAVQAGHSPGASDERAGQGAMDLLQLTEEVQRRERSFQSLLQDLDRISAKCDQLAQTMQPAPASPHQWRIPASRAAGPAKSGAWVPGAGCGSTGSSTSSGNGAETASWSWESLLEFEQKIRRQHQELVAKGVLPPSEA